MGIERQIVNIPTNCSCGIVCKVTCLEWNIALKWPSHLPFPSTFLYRLVIISGLRTGKQLKIW